MEKDLKILDDQIIFYKSLKERWPPIEEDFKILKVEYLRNHLLDQTQILNLGLDNQTIFYKSLKERWPPMEENLKILKVEYLRNHLLDQTLILNLGSDDQTVFYKSLKERWKKTSGARWAQSM